MHLGSILKTTKKFTFYSEKKLKRTDSQLGRRVNGGVNVLYSNSRPNIGNFDLSQNTKSPWISNEEKPEDVKENWVCLNTFRIIGLFNNKAETIALYKRYYRRTPSTTFALFCDAKPLFSKVLCKQLGLFQNPCVLEGVKKVGKS